MAQVLSQCMMVQSVMAQILSQYMMAQALLQNTMAQVLPSTKTSTRTMALSPVSVSHHLPSPLTHSHDLKV